MAAGMRCEGEREGEGCQLLPERKWKIQYAGKTGEEKQQIENLRKLDATADGASIGRPRFINAPQLKVPGTFTFSWGRRGVISWFSTRGQHAWFEFGLILVLSVSIKLASKKAHIREEVTSLLPGHVPSFSSSSFPSIQNFLHPFHQCHITDHPAPRSHPAGFGRSLQPGGTTGSSGYTHSFLPSGGKKGEHREIEWQP